MYVLCITYINYICNTHMYVCMYAVLHWRSQKNNLPQKLNAPGISATKCQFG